MLIGACDPMLCSNWGFRYPILVVMMPSWLPLWMLLAIAYVFGVLCMAIELFTAAEALPAIVTAVSCTATSTSFLDHFSRTSQPHPTPHAPCAILYVVPMLIGCWLVLGI